ncbi:MAG: tRNA (guanosine(37)-N1)-methyltransferase TrmD [Actinomycetales bacterium]
MRADVVSIFPEYLEPLRLSLIGKAIRTGLLDLHVHDLRAVTTDRHRTVDDTPFGGGAGMVMTPEPWAQTLAAIHSQGQETGARPRLLVPAPSGRPLTQEFAYALAAEPWLVIACGRYEGIDERVLQWAEADFEVTPVSIGDYVLCGGEAAALVILEAVVRLLPGVLGNADSLVEESHTGGLLEYPLYTKPADWRGLEVPGVLLSGDHAAIAAWRHDQRLRRTLARRPDLLSPADLTGTLDLPDPALVLDVVGPASQAEAVQNAPRHEVPTTQSDPSTGAGPHRGAEAADAEPDSSDLTVVGDSTSDSPVSRSREVSLGAGPPDAHSQDAGTSVTDSRKGPMPGVWTDPQLQVRLAVPADAGELFVLQRACWLDEQQQNPDVVIPALAESLDDVRTGLTEWVTLVVRVGGRLIASGRGQFRADDGTWHVGRLMVAPDLRGRGLGRWLLGAVEGLAPSEATRYELFTGARSTANLRMYRRAGYRPAGGFVPEGAVMLARRIGSRAPAR